MFSYAGFAAAYVKGKDYDKDGLFPTAKFLTQLLADESIKSPVQIVDFYPGDSVTLPDGKITKAFVTDYDDQDIKSVTDVFYRTYKNIEECISYRKLDAPSSVLADWIDDFLMAFNDFVERRVQGPDSHFTDLLGKTFSLEVSLSEEEDVKRTIEFGRGQIEYQPDANKLCFVGGEALFSILKGESLFEDLYTGYNAEWKRNPQDVYNRDIVMMIVMFSYVYKNRLSGSFKEKYLSKDLL